MVRTPDPDDIDRSPCPIANSLDRIGDRWTLLIVRDLLSGPSTFKDLLAGPERIATNVLADRLKRLEGAGLIRRTAYQDRPRRYRYSLTASGRDLEPVLDALAKWGRTHIPGTRGGARLRR